jgi:ribosome biogenesis ATPase
VPFISVSAPSIVSGMSGESEKTLRETFEEAKVRLIFCRKYCTVMVILIPDFRLFQRLAPSLLFIDEIDAITPKRESAQREMERRIVAQFLTCMDGMF